MTATSCEDDDNHHHHNDHDEVHTKVITQKDLGGCHYKFHIKYLTTIYMRNLANAFPPPKRVTSLASVGEILGSNVGSFPHYSLLHTGKSRYKP